MSPSGPGGQPTAAVLASDTEELDYSARLALLAAIVESSDDAIVSKTLTGRILSWNAGATRIFGYRAEEVIGKPITVIIPQELHSEEERILEKLRRGESIEHFDTIRVRKDGERIPISLTVSPVRDSRGRIIAASKVARDISERKRAEQQLLEGERRIAAEADALARLNDHSTRLWRSGTLEAGLEEMLAAALELLAADRGVLHLFNETGGQQPTVVQRGFEATLPDLLRADANGAPARSVSCREQVLVEDIDTDPHSDPCRERARAAGIRAFIATPLIDTDGTVLAVISACFGSTHRPTPQQLRRLDLYLLQAVDFIQRCRLEQVLRQNEESLRESDRRKNEFLAVLAHELRNPLAPIRYALATAKVSGRTLEQQRRAEEVIERQVAHMSRLLEDLLDISRISHHTLELQRSHIELAAVIATSLETARPALDGKRHAVSVELPRQPVRLDADPVRLAQVFSNLLINAAKYTNPGGHIRLHAALVKDQVVVTVSDDGIGIAPEMMPRLFTLFAQAQPALGRTEGGLGVGLALVRGIVTLHGGSVAARSAGLGRGSEFTVRLPVEQALGETPEARRGQEALARGADGQAGLKILVVDDSRDAADVSAMLLELSGHQVQTAYSARRALELGEIFHPDALLLDIGLPDLDGYQLARRIRGSSWGRATLLVAVTGWGQSEDRRRALEAGFDHHLTKPIAPETLDSLLRSLQGERAAR